MNIISSFFMQEMEKNQNKKQNIFIVLLNIDPFTFRYGEET